MRFLRLAKKNRDVSPTSLDTLYSNRVIMLIRKKYSVSDELAILRQRDVKAEEFDAYNAYVEDCKATAKGEMELD